MISCVFVFMISSTDLDFATLLGNCHAGGELPCRFIQSFFFFFF